MINKIQNFNINNYKQTTQSTLVSKSSVSFKAKNSPQKTIPILGDEKFFDKIEWNEERTKCIATNNKVGFIKVTNMSDNQEFRSSKVLLMDGTCFIKRVYDPEKFILTEEKFNPETGDTIKKQSDYYASANDKTVVRRIIEKIDDNKSTMLEIDFIKNTQKHTDTMLKPTYIPIYDKKFQVKKVDFVEFNNPFGLASKSTEETYNILDGKNQLILLKKYIGDSLKSVIDLEYDDNDNLKEKTVIEFRKSAPEIGRVYDKNNNLIKVLDYDIDNSNNTYVSEITYYENDFPVKAERFNEYNQLIETLVYDKNQNNWVIE